MEFKRDSTNASSPELPGWLKTQPTNLKLIKRLSPFTAKKMNIKLKRTFCPSLISFFLICALTISMGLPRSAWAVDHDLKTFLSYCGWGTLAGAGVGAMSLAFVDSPTKKTNNIAIGASLGLYAGIGYGFFILNQTPADDSARTQDFSWFFWPQFKDQKLDGAALAIKLKSF